VTTPAATTGAAKPAPVWEDLVDIFYAPRQVFERRRDGKFGLALVIVLVLATVLLYLTKPLLQPVYDAILEMSIAQARASNPQITDEMVGTMRGFSDKVLLPGLIFNLGIAILLTGLALWLVGKLFESKQTLGQAMMVSTYANVPRLILGTVVSAVLALLLPAESLDSPFAAALSPARFVDHVADPVLAAALMRFELFTIWATVLLGVGLYVTGRVTARQAGIAAFLVWLMAGLLTIAGALRNTA
jgi:hypothetical protein